jgi:hypothetical protein
MTRPGLALIIGPHPRTASVHASTPPVLSFLVSIVVSNSLPRTLGSSIGVVICRRLDA